MATHGDVVVHDVVTDVPPPTGSATSRYPVIVEPLWALAVNATDAPPSVGVTDEIVLADGVPTELADAGAALPFVAATLTRSVADSSATCTAYVEAVAPAMLFHVDPPSVDDCHWYANVNAVPVHVPVVAVNVEPALTVPDTVGTTELEATG